MNSKDYIKLSQLCAVIQEQSDKKHVIINDILQREGDINFKIPFKSCPNRYHENSVNYTALYSALETRQIEIFNILLARGADFTVKNENGETILHQAIASSCLKYANCWKIKGRLEHPFIASILLAHIKANDTQNSRNKHGISYFHSACMTNNVKAVEFYLNHGISVNEVVPRDSSVLAGYTGLHFAARYCCLEIAKILLRFGANAQLKDANGMTPLYMLLERNMEIVDWMNMGKRASYDHFIADFKDNEQMIELILAKSYRDWKVHDDVGLSRFHVVCTIYDQSRIEELFGKLVDLQRHVSKDSPRWAGYTPLHFAAHFSVETVKLLMKNGANILAKDAKGITPFDLCLQRYEAENIHYLVMNQPSWKYILMSDGKTRLSDLVLAMRSAKQLKSYLETMENVNTFVPMDAPLWPGCTPLHLITIFPERTRDILDLYAATEYSFDESNKQKYFNCSEAKEKLYIQRVKVCLRLNTDVTAQDASQSTALHRAFRLHRESAVNKFLHNEHNVWNCRDYDGLTHLHIACAAQRRDIIDKLLDERNVNEPVPASFKWFKPYYWDTSSYFYISTESTLLHIAVTCENDNLTEILLKHGADVYAKDVNGLTPIHRLFATRSRNKTARDLFSQDQLKDCVLSGCGLSHLHVACFMSNCEVVGKLLDNGADINGTISYKSPSTHNDGEATLSDNSAFDLYDDTSPDPMSFLSLYDGYTPLHFALKNQDLDVVKLLVQRGADIHAKKSDGSAPLYIVLDNRRLGLTKFFIRLLERNSTLRERMTADTGITMLHVACATLDMNLMKDLLDQGIDDVNARTHEDSQIWPGCTPLHLLSTPLSQDERDKVGAMIDLLLQHDADVTLMNAKENSPLHKLYSVIEPFVTNNPHADTLLRAQKDYSVNPTDSNGLSHFHFACAKNQVDIVEKFLKHGVDVNHAIDHFYMGFGGFTPLHVAVFKDSRETIDLLLKHGADVNAEDRHGNTPLHVAAERDEMSRRLIEQIINGGADIRAKNLFGKTLFEVLMTKWTDVPGPIVELFLKHGWQVNTFNPVSEEGTLAMAFNTSNNNQRGVDKPAFTLLLRSPDVATLDEHGRNAIHNIVSSQQPQHNNSAEDYASAIEMLVQLGCDYDLQNHLGRTPLHLAVEFRQIEAISGLLQSGADVNILDAEGKPAFSYILKYLHKRLVHDREIVERIAIHLRKMVHLGLDVSQVNVETVIAARKSLSFDVTIDQEFDKSLQMLKERKIGSTQISFYDFASETGAVSSYPYATPQERQAIKEAFENDFESLRKEFPEVAGFLRLQYKKARARLALINPAIDSLGIIIGFELPVLCFDVVLKFLRNGDLKNLIVAADY